MRDANLISSCAFPAAGGTAATIGIDLGESLAMAHGTRLPSKVEAVISYTALPNLADAHSATLTLQDSDDNLSFTSISDVATITGAGGIGAAAGNTRFRLPPLTRRYLCISITVAAGGGDNSASTATLSLDVFP